MSCPLISVVMPVYNCAQYVHEAIESILGQTYRNFEFIIVNDGSTDATPEIANEYAERDGRIRVIHQPKSGIPASRNKGITESGGEWIFCMDGDDISMPHRFAVQMEAVEKNPSLILFGGCCRQINAAGTPVRINKYPVRHKDLVNNLETLRPFFPHSSACYKRSAVLKSGCYRERFQYAQDHDLWLRLSLAGEIGCSNKIVLQLRKHDNNVSDVFFYVQKTKGIAALVCHFRKRFGLSDLYALNEAEWEYFLAWIGDKLREYGYFEMRILEETLSKTLFYKRDSPVILRAGNFIYRAVRRPHSAFEIIKTRLFGSSLPKRLAEESRQIWP